jgi:uncharacterized Fe-S center protein
MSNSDVYFTDMRTKPGNDLLNKLEKLVKKAGMLNIDYTNKYTAIKIHFGEPGNLAYIKPNYAAVIAKIIKEQNGLPFLTDTNTLYTGKRSNAVDHLASAMSNGFSPIVVGCNVLIADGLKGTDYCEVEINQKNCKTAKIGTVINDSDIIISMNHFKGHEMTGFGGALKNIGMGCGSRGGKLEMHSASKPEIKAANCTACRMCIKACAHDAIKINSDKVAEINYDKCVGCGQCVAVCQYNAALVVWDEAADLTNEKIAEYSLAVLKDKPAFHINFVMNVSPNCDCWANNDYPIVPDIGIAASFDPIALDCACADMVNSAPMLKGSELHDKSFSGEGDKFNHIHSNTDWRHGMVHAEKIGLGNQKYNLVKV